MIKKSLKERRKYPRLKVETEITVESVTENRKINALLKDISAGGCCLKCSVSPSVILHFTVGDSDIIAKAAPVWKKYNHKERAYQIGYEFTNIPPHTKDKLKQYINKKI